MKTSKVSILNNLQKHRHSARLFICTCMIISFIAIYPAIILQAEAASLGANLLTNPGGETVTNNYGQMIKNGWSGDSQWYSYSGDFTTIIGLYPSLSSVLTITPKSGSYYMGICTSASPTSGTYSCYQDVDISSQSTAVDNNTILFSLSGYLAATGGNTSEISLQELDSGKNVISTATFDQTVTSSSWTKTALSGAVASGARYLRVTMTGTHSYLGQVAFDDLDLELKSNTDEAPDISQISDQLVQEGTTLGPLSFTATDNDTSLSSLTISAASSDTTLIPDLSVSLDTNGAGSITLYPGSDNAGDAIITITVSDGTKSSVTTFTVTVYPEISLDTNLIVNGTGDSLSGWTNTNGRFRISSGVFTQTVSTSSVYMYQDVNVVKYGALIDESFLTYTASCNGTNGELILYFLNSTGSEISNSTIGSGTIPDGTRTVRVSVGGPSGCTIDNVSFKINSTGLPKITTISNQAVASGGNLGDLSFTVGYAGSSVTLEATSSNKSLVPTANISFGGSNYQRTIKVALQSGVYGSTTISILVNGTSLTSFTVTAYIPVTDITDVPTTKSVGTPLTLSGSVSPSNATHTAITWSVNNPGKTGASINGDILSTIAEGTVIVTATIPYGSNTGTYFSKDYTITVNKSTLAAPSGLDWSGTTPGKATWSEVTNTVSYTVQLYLDGSVSGSAVTGITTEDYDFTSVITVTGSYTFTVTAVGDGTYFADSAVSSASPNYSYNATPTGTVAAQTVKGGGSVTVQSSKTGTAYLVDSTLAATTVDKVSELDVLVTAGTATSVTITAADTDTTMIAPATAGTYALVVADTAGNVSGMSSNLVTVDTTAPTGTVTKQSVKGGGSVTVQSSETGTAYLVLKSLAATAVDTVSELNALVAAGTAASAVTAADTDTTMIAPVTAGTYALVVADTAGNVSAMGTTYVTVSGPILSKVSVSSTGTASFTTDEAGTYYYRISGSTSAAKLIMQYGTSGTAAVGTNTFSFSLSGFTASTAYYLNICEVDALGNVSSVATRSFTTATTMNLSAPTGSGVSVSTSDIVLSFSCTVTAVANNKVTISDGTTTYTYTIPSDSTIVSGTGTACVATIPIADFMNGTTPLSLGYSTSYTVSVSSGAFVDVNTLSISKTTFDSFTTVSAANTFVAVTSITGVPTTAVTGSSLTLSGTVNPSTVTNQTITWTLKSAGTTGASVTNGVLSTTSVGTVTVTATITNGKTASTDYTQDFDITVSAATPTFVAVTSITNVPTTATAGTDLTLSGTVEPTSATNQTITWTLKSAGTTGASVTNGVLSTTAAGTVTVTATVANGKTSSTNYTKDFDITVSTADTFVAVTSITGVPTTATAGTDLTLSGTVNPTSATNQTIAWTLKSAGTTGASVTNGVLSTTAAGTVTVTATVANGKTSSTDYTQNFDITVSAATPTFVAVTSITGVPTAATAGTDLTLSGTVNPTSATNQTIAWTLKSAGTTGASVTNGVLSTTAAGTVTVTATITNGVLSTTAAGTVTVTATITNGKTASTDYTQDFDITVSAATPTFVAVTSITNVPTTATAGTDLTLSGTVEPSSATNQTITWTLKSAGETGASVTNGVLFTTSAGTVTVTATITNGKTSSTDYTQDFDITVSAATPTFVAVTSITNVPTTATAGTDLTLSGTVNPSTATNQTITWTLKSAGTTGASVTNGVLSTTAAGTMTVTATIANGATSSTDYTQNFDITVSAATPTFVAVTSITNVPTTATAGTDLTLSGTVNPSTATNQTIAWTLKSAGTTGASVTNGVLSTTAAGTVTVTATITNGKTSSTDYTQDFEITVSAATPTFVAVTSITNVPTTATAGTDLTLSGTVNPSTATNQTIAWTLKSAGTTGASVTNGVLSTTAAGTVTVTATITNGKTSSTDYTQDFEITVSAATPTFVAVTSITNVPTTAMAGTDLTLSGTVNPSTATNQAITWILKSAGTTNASVTNGVLSTTAAGTVTVTATITNGKTASTDYTQDFDITVSAATPTFVAVTSITNVPTTAMAGTDLTLSGTVNPSTATNQTITWTLKNAGTTGASVTNGVLSTTGAGTVTVTATITNGATSNTNYTQDFNFTLEAALTNNYSIILQSGGNGTVSANVYSATKGTQITLTTTPDTGYRFKEWQVVDGGVTITDNKFTMPENNVTVKAIFEQIPATTYQVTINGSYATTSGAGSYSSGDIVTVNAGSRSNYTFSGWTSTDGITFANANSTTTTFTMPGGNVTITASWSYNGGSGGSSGGGGNAGNTDSSATDDFDTTEVQPETKPDQPTIGSATVKAKKGTDSSATAEIPEKTVANAIAKAQAEATEQEKTENGIGVSLSVSSPAGTKSLGIVLTQPTLTQLTKAGVSQFEIDGSLGTLNFELEAIKEIQKQSTGDVTINITPVAGLNDDAKTLVGTRPVYNISISYVEDGKTVNITTLGSGSVTLSIPYTPGKNEAVGYLFGVYVDGKGNATRIEASTYDANSKSIILGSNHFSVYGVGYMAPSEKFKDISSHWAKESIDYVVGRGLFSGTSATAFSPDAAMSRGMLVTALGRLAGVDVGDYKTVSFTDVAADKYYAPYIEWAYKNGIVSGIGNSQFAPERAITREKIALILSNYAKATGYTLPVTREAAAFADDSGIGSTYKEAVTTMQQAGIMMGGNGNKFNPGVSATRAEVSSMLHRYIKLTIDPATAQGWAVNDAGQRLYYKDGKALTSWQTIASKKYFFDTDGAMQTGWKKDDKSNWYYLSINGALVGWQNIVSGDSKKRYYFTKDAVMVSAKWLEIDKKWYYFNTDGSLAVSTIVDGYEVDKNGVRQSK